MSEKTEQKPLKPLQPKISLFGPPGSGKSTLLIALRDFIVSHPESVKFTLTDTNERDVALSIKPHQSNSQERGIQATQKIEFFNVEFQRKRPSQESQESYSAQISSFSHKFQIVDNAGEKLKTLPQQRMDTIVSNYQNPHGIIILLDYNQVEAVDDEQQTKKENQATPSDERPFSWEEIEEAFSSIANETPSNKNKRPFSREEYYDMVSGLVSVAQENVYFAFCITKIDSFDRKPYDIVQNSDPLDFINDYFGEEMKDKIVHLQEKRPDKIKVFKISAFGRAKDDTSNWDDEAKTLKDPDNWDPINLTDPFFWLLDEMERGWIKENSRGPLARLFLNDRLKAFVPLYKEKK